MRTEAAPAGAGGKQARTPLGRFAKGRSGNPSGRRRGTRNRATELAESLLDDEAEALVRKVVELAKEGDLAALRMCLDRLVPPRRSRPVRVSLPDTSTARGVLEAHDAVLQAAADGTITPEEAATMASLLEGKRKAIETADLAEELRQVKEMVGNRR